MFYKGICISPDEEGVQPWWVWGVELLSVLCSWQGGAVQVCERLPHWLEGQVVCLNLVMVRSCLIRLQDAYHSLINSNHGLVSTVEPTGKFDKYIVNLNSICRHCKYSCIFDTFAGQHLTAFSRLISITTKEEWKLNFGLTDWLCPGAKQWLSGPAAVFPSVLCSFVQAGDKKQREGRIQRLCSLSSEGVSCRGCISLMVSACPDNPVHPMILQPLMRSISGWLPLFGSSVLPPSS
jgi:hypothetical protein